MGKAKMTAEELERLAIEEVPFAGNMGIKFTQVDEGYVVARLPYQDDFIRPGGTIAGPVMMAMADLVLWGVVMSQLGPVKLAVTTNLNINFLRRPTPGELTAVGSNLKLGQRLAIGEVSLLTGGKDGDLVAHVTGTYSIPPRS
jgi:uncharacterized protein (TIGR00369 family)